jgi:cytochrome c oxidase cbb3-type subunit 3
MKNRIAQKILLGTLLSLLPLATFAQDAGSKTSWWEANAQEALIWSVLALEFLLLLVVITLYVVIRMIANKLFAPEPEVVEVSEEAHQQKIVLEPKETFVQRVMHQLTDAVPVEREEEVMTDHEYDGIYELDNNLPPWWKAMFYVTIVFGVAYLLHYHIFDTGDLQETEYEKEVAEAQAEIDAYLATQGNNVDETNVTLIEDDARLASGQELYVQKCSPCHGAEGGGGVGPNLTDQYWIHGGDIKDIYRTIKYGVPAKGMIPWESQLSPTQMQDISSFIITLEGTNPPNPKEPEGELYERESSVALAK